MQLNLYKKEEKDFDINKFKNLIKNFLLQNQIKSTNESIDFKNVLFAYKTIVEKELIGQHSKDKESLEINIKNTYNQLDILEKSELYENLLSHEKSVTKCLIKFTKQYIEALNNNNTYYYDVIIKYENIIINTDINEKFKIAKKHFALCLKHKKLSFDDNIIKEVNNLKQEYGFKEIMYRKAITIREKMILINNIQNFKSAIDELLIDLNIEKNRVSLNGLISISFEPTILEYSATIAYMRSEDNAYIISLGKYKNNKELKTSYIHELAHCFDYNNVNINNQKITYSEQAILDIQSGNIDNPIKKIMHREILFNEDYKAYHNKYYHMQDEIIEVIKKDFNINLPFYIKSKDLYSNFDLIIDNYYHKNVYQLIQLKLAIALHDNGYYKEANEVRNKNFETNDLEDKYKNIEEKFNNIRKQYNYIVSNNVSFFLHEDKKSLSKDDEEMKIHYFTKPVEIFARAFEIIYTQENFDNKNDIVCKEKKEAYRLLLKEALEYMLPNNRNTLKIK